MLLLCVYVVVSRSGPNASLSDGIATLTKMNAKLERMLAKIGTKADNSEFRDRMHQEQNAATQLVKEIIGQLKTNHSESAVFHRLRTQFEKEFKRYQGLNTQMDQRQVRVIDAVKARKTSAAGAGGHYDEEDPLTARQQTTYSDDYNGRNGYPQTQQQQQQQQQQLTAADLDIQFIEYDIEELEKRQREIGQIEQDVQEVSEMFKDLSVSRHLNMGIYGDHAIHGGGGGGG